MLALSFILTGCGSNDRLFKKGVAYAKAGKTEAALNAYNKILKDDPDYLSALINRAILLEKLGDFDRAEADYKHAVKLNPYHPNVLTNLGSFYLNRNNPLDALSNFNIALASSS